MRTAAPPIDLLDAEFYVDGAREAYRWMRHNAPVYFDEKNHLWGIATYDGVRAAEGNATVFSNAGGSRPDTGPLPWMMDMDAPEHLKRRKLVNRAFTPARVRAALPRVRAICDELIDAVCDQGACDFRHDLAAPLPLIVIFERLLERLPDLELADDRPPARSITGISEMPVRFTPASRSTR